MDQLAREQFEVMQEAKRLIQGGEPAECKDMLRNAIVWRDVVASGLASYNTKRQEINWTLKARDIAERTYWTDGVRPLYVDSFMRPSAPTGLFTIAAQSHKFGGWGAHGA